MRVLVTGAAGFLGSAFVREVLATRPGAEVLSFDLLTYAGHRANLEGLPDPARHGFVRGDVADAAAVAAAFAQFRPDAVVHFAAETHVDRSTLDATPFVRTNVLGTQVLLDACLRHGAPLVHVGTDEVYGSLPEPEAAEPDRALRPTNPYAASKAAADWLVLAAVATRGQDARITRASNGYGPRQLPEKLIPLMLLRARAGAPLPLYGDGGQVRQWLHAEDHARGVLAALERGRAGGVYHLAGETRLSNLDLVRRLLALVGAPADLVRFVRDRPAHDRRYALADGGTGAELGWRPRVPFERGLAETAAWYAAHPGWLAAVASPDLTAFLDRNYAGRGAGSGPPP